MTWQENLINNLIVFAVLGAIGLFLYLKISKKTIPELIRDLRGGFSDE